MLAPIVLFVYNRPWHTEQTLNALMKNELADQSDLFIFADGPKDDMLINDLQLLNETREVIKKKKWCKNVEIILSERNKGLADSIVSGVTEIVNKYGKVIVLEDDIVTSKGFLKYMNDALSLYQDEDKVMHISGYMFPHKKKLPETFFFNVPMCWGWATWKRAWSNFVPDTSYLYNYFNENNLWDSFNKFGSKELQMQLEANYYGYKKTWFVKWHSSLMIKNGYTLYPHKSLVENVGFDNTGQNCNEGDNLNSETVDYITVNPIMIEENKEASKIIYNIYKRNDISYYLKHNDCVDNIKLRIRNFLSSILLKIMPELSRLVTKNIGITKSTISDKTRIMPNCYIEDSKIGDYTYVSNNGVITKTNIGRFCSIGPNLLCGWGIHPTNGISTSPMFYSTNRQNGYSLCSYTKFEERKTINIGNDVFIGANVTILDGVSIGNGAVIGAGAIVSKDIPAYAIAVGSPIRIIKYRFSESQIEKLEKLAWWNFDEEKLKEVEKYFFDIDSFLKNNGL